MNMIVIAEDDESLGEFLTSVLNEKYAEVAWTKSGKKVLTMVNDSTKLVILDVSLYDLDGITVCKNLRKKFPDKPIILLTAHDETYVKHNALVAGANEFITKPFTLEHLLERLHEYLH